MPAYRSEAEAEIRVEVVALLRRQMPGCRIIHEINCAVWGPNRIDVMAVLRDAPDPLKLFLFDLLPGMDEEVKKQRTAEETVEAIMENIRRKQLRAETERQIAEFKMQEDTRRAAHLRIARAPKRRRISLIHALALAIYLDDERPLWLWWRRRM